MSTETGMDDYSGTFRNRINLVSRFGLIRRCIPHLLESDCPSVVSISSMLGRMPDLGFLASNSINAGLKNITRELATEFSPESASTPSRWGPT